VIAPHDVEACVDATAALIGDPRRRREMGAAARGRAETFDLDHYGEGLARVLSGARRHAAAGGRG
jgi:hypothetical protein